MIQRILSCLCGLAVTSLAYGQTDVDTRITEAEVAYEQADYESARLAVQQALTELNTVIATEVLALLPTELEELTADLEQDSYTGQLTTVGNLFVNRSYLSEDQSQQLAFELLNDSPMLGMVNTFLTSPLMGLVRDENQKVVRIQGYKAMYERSEDDESSVTISLPFGGNSMLFFQVTGYEDESDVLGKIELFPIKDIINLAE